MKVGPWTRELGAINIHISDIGTDSRTVDLLIGGDVAGKLLTGKNMELRSGPIAFETLLGWTLLGKTKQMLQQ